MKRTIDVLYLVLVPVMGLLVALGPVWIPVIYGRQWLPMSNIMLIILFPHLAMAMMMILSSLMSAQGNSRGSFIFYGIYNCIYWSALIVLTPRFGFLVFPFTEWIALAGCFILLMELRSIGFDTTMVWKYAGVLVLAVSGSTFLWTIARYRSLLETVILTIAISALWVTMSPGRKEIIRWAKL